ncbi:something about silencing, SAS, complex subunit 4-domain-containing protein [Lipomyces oligophaga]|uniref:something about silencing, SAS, complex subunit 4-domain-containing protein n=1 Tax=Lipomyces oligophaga TaxID=45792 RepID=UPI0034D00D3B
MPPPSLQSIVTYFLGSPSPPSQPSSDDTSIVGKITDRSGGRVKSQESTDSDSADTNKRNTNADRIYSDESKKASLRSRRTRLGAPSSTDSILDFLWFETLELTDHIPYEQKCSVNSSVSVSLDGLDTASHAELPSKPPLIPRGPFGFRPLSKESQLALYESKSVSRRFARDPLSDTSFINLHRRGEREEKHYQNFERDKIMYERLRCERHLDTLNGPDWIKSVLALTPVDNPSDDSELSNKRTKLIQELQSLLDKFELWKENEKSFKSLTDRDRDATQRERLQRLQTRKKSLLLSSSASLLAKTSTTRRRGRPRKTEASVSISPSKPQFSSKRIAKQKPEDPNLRIISTIHRKRSEPLAFGYPVPSIHYSQFKIPESWIRIRDDLRRSQSRNLHALHDGSINNDKINNISS